jgi:MinD-like ATPase involved in chromosome partitioning or flagellar assembly
MFVCWSSKGGSGTTVVSAALALTLSRAHPAVLVDLAGDLPAALGVPEPGGPGVGDWLASPTATAEALGRLAIAVTDNLSLLPCGTQADVTTSARWREFADAVATLDPHAVIDAGTGAPPAELVGPGTQSLLVTRSCYLGLRRAVTGTVKPSGVVLVLEPGRALTAGDIERAMGAPVVAEIPYDPAVARAVDAGLLASRLPRSLSLRLTDVA